MGGFDIIYACQDADYDSQRKLNSIPAKYGIAKALRIALLSHLITIVMLFGLWWISELGIVFLLGMILLSGLLLYQHSLVRPDDLQRVNMAFFNVNAVISFGILLFGCADLALSKMS